MGYYIALPLILIVTALQSSIVPLMRWYSGQPNFVLLMVIVWAAYVSFEEGLFWAFVAGIAQDLMSVQPLGTSIIPLVIMVFVVTTVRDQLYNLNILLILIFVLSGTLLQQVVSFVMLSQIGLGGGLVTIVRFVTIPTLLYNLAFALPIFWVMGWIARRTPERGFQYQGRL
jgi:rod shape-determining protein MreD